MAGRSSSTSLRSWASVETVCPGEPHHEPAANLIPNLQEIAQTRKAMLKRKLRRVQASVVRVVGGLVPQEIAIGARIKKRLVARAGALTERKRHGAVGVRSLDGRHDLAEKRVRKRRVLPSLKHKGTKAKLVAPLAARENCLGAKAIAFRALVGTTKAAVEAIVSAVAAYFYESANKDIVAIHRAASLNGALCRILCQLGSIRPHKLLVLLKRERVPLG